MEIKTCEQYVLSELERLKEENVSLKQEVWTVRSINEGLRERIAEMEEELYGKSV